MPEWARRALIITFIAIRFPTQYIGQKFPIAKYLGVHIVLWGGLVMLHAVCYNFAGFYALRFFLGMLEACVSPSLILIVSMWYVVLASGAMKHILIFLRYKSNERATRIGWFYAGNLATSIVGGAVAYGVTFYQGSIAPWKLL